MPSGQPGYSIQRVAGNADVWILGLHGGAGSSTVAGLLQASRLSVCETATWPQLAHGRANVLLVARTNGAGLDALRTAERQWASGDLDDVVSLVGTVLVADGPKPHRATITAIKKSLANSPKTWHLGWNEAWRPLGPADSYPTRTRDSLMVASIIRRLQDLNRREQQDQRVQDQHHDQQRTRPGAHAQAPDIGRPAQAAG